MELAVEHAVDPQADVARQLRLAVAAGDGDQIAGQHRPLDRGVEEDLVRIDAVLIVDDQVEEGVYPETWTIPEAYFVMDSGEINGLIHQIPEGSSAIVRALRSGAETATAMPGASSIADSLTVEMPRNSIGCLAEIRASEGGGVTVSEDQILAAISRLGSATGVFAEPAGAAALAGLVTALEKDLVDRHERVILMITGSGLKDVDAAATALPTLESIQSNLESVMRAAQQSEER